MWVSRSTGGELGEERVRVREAAGVLCVWMCGADYGERRSMHSNLLTSTLPSELGDLTQLIFLCVRPTPPPDLG